MKALPFRRIAIVNRGEAAMRLLRAVHELNAEHGLAIETVIFYTTADVHNLVVQEATEAFCIGEPMYVTADGQSRSSYLDYPRLGQALTDTEADAVWVGWGFAAEDPDFAELCEQRGLTFVGPRSSVMRRLADKVASKRLAEETGVPVVPWSGGVVETVEEARAVGERIGCPLVVKASAGGGGRGIRRVLDPSEIPDAFERARSEADRAFGCPDVFMERMVSDARHVEVQILGDKHGTVWALGSRDCSVQRRQQKIIEEGPPPTLSPDERERLHGAAIALARAAGYTNAGTVEFLFDENTRELFFMEMNTRLQVEHPVTEVTTGVDIVKQQLFIASGGKLAPDPPPTSGHAIELRINAEDVANGFTPSPGVIRSFRTPGGAGVRVDSGYFVGDLIPRDFDSMVAKVIAHGATREEARARARRALRETALVIDGGVCNKAFLHDLLGHQDFIDARLDTRWLDRQLQDTGWTPREGAHVALCRAAIAVYITEHVADRAQFLASMARGRARVRQEVGLPVELRHAGVGYELAVHCVGSGQFAIDVASERINATLEERTGEQSWLTLGRRRYHTILQAVGLDYLVEVDGTPHRISRDDGGAVRAAGPSIVVAIDVAEGRRVCAGDRLLVLEAMKMELPVVAPADGIVRDIRVNVGGQVDVGSLLMVIAPADDLDDDDASQQSKAKPAALVFHNAEENVEQLPRHGDQYQELLRERYQRDVRALMPLVLGLDIRRAEARGLRRELEALQTELSPHDAETIALEVDVINAFVDVVDLYAGTTTARGVSEVMQAYARSLDDRARGLPAAFVDKLKRVLARFDVTSLDRNERLEAALYWSYRAYCRVSQITPVIGGILERWLLADKMYEALESTMVADVLARLQMASQDAFGQLHELTLQARYRFFDKPLLERERERVYDDVRRQLDQLDDEPSASEHERIVDLLMGCPQPLTSFLSAWLHRATEPVRALLLECLVRRFYAAHRLSDETTWHEDDLVGFSASFRFRGGERIAGVGAGNSAAVCGATCRWDELEHTLAKLSRVASKQAVDVVALELFVDVTNVSHSFERIAELITAHANLERVGRVCVCLISAEFHRARDYATFIKTDDGGLSEIRAYRGIHAMWASRLELWRLRNFEIERLRGAPDIYVFIGTARDNSRDQRLFTFTDVRDVTASRDASTGAISLPNFERMFRDTLADMRNTQFSSNKRLLWNRAVFYLWQELPFELEQLYDIVRRLAPETRGLNLEKIVVRVRVQRPPAREPRWVTVEMGLEEGALVDVYHAPYSEEPLRSLSPYEQRVVRCRSRGVAYPYEIIKMLASRSEGTSVLMPHGDFVEHDLDDSGESLVPVARPPGENRANVVVGVVRNFTERYPEGMTRVVILGDPTREMGALAEPECRRVIAALDLAQQMSVPVDWFPVSAGAKISLDSGTENLDWTARVLRRLIEFCRDGEVNVVVAAINVGAQSYWNAEATMLMHTRGILVMTEQASMVLTGKRALDYSGSVSADSHLDIGGAERIMGPNGQAQYVVKSLVDACILLSHYYEMTYVAPGERTPRRMKTGDAWDRNICASPHDDEDLKTIGDIFGEANVARKRPFDIRSVMRAVADADHPALERWQPMADAETTVVWDAPIGGWPVTLIGIESKPRVRLVAVAGDGPPVAAGGALMPLSSKKMARAINAASGRRPVVVLANLSGFDGSPESLRLLQLEYGAEIGRAVVEFDGTIIFCVVSRYHGGSYVVFSRTLNEGLHAMALDGAYASVIGGAPAAAVVLTRQVRARVLADPMVVEVREQLDAADERDRPRLLADLHARMEASTLAEQSKMAREFDAIHSVERARDVGSLDEIIAPARLRPRLIDLLSNAHKDGK